MQKTALPLLVFSIVLVSCQGRTTASVHTTDTAMASQPVDTMAGASKTDTAALEKAIIPGERLGHITIGLNADSVEPILGMPDASDAAMGKAWLTWKSKTEAASVLNIYTAYKDTSLSQKTVQQIRTTSLFFKTISNIHVGSSLNEVQEGFPAAAKTSTYTEAGAAFTLYDDTTAGIAFELNEGVCKGIIIHQKGRRADAIYIMLHPNMKRL